MNTDIFKAYDIRGIYGEDFDEHDAYVIGRALVEILKIHIIAVGRDARISGPMIQSELIRGILDAGCDVVDIGMITTPMLYFASWQLLVDAAISVTASHNPAEYNGFKICLKDAVPIGGDTGLFDIRDHAVTGNFSDSTTQGVLSIHDIKPDYYQHFLQFADFGDKKFHIVIDCANTMGVLELPFYEHFPKNFQIDHLYCDLDHPYTAHEANPLKIETLDELRARVVEVSADLGIAYDGDADRIGFVDEKGEIIPMDLATGLIASVILKSHPHATILYDLRSSRTVREAIEEAGGIAKECRVGHAFIKRQMIEEQAVFAGELSGHYYFNANKNGEASTLAAFTLLNYMAHTEKPISELVKNLQRYAHSEEINSEVHDKDAIIAELKKKYSDGIMSTLDGIKIDYPDWWFNVRPSNTEPILRLNLEARTQEQMEQKQHEILTIIRR